MRLIVMYCHVFIKMLLVVFFQVQVDKSLKLV